MRPWSCGIQMAFAGEDHGLPSGDGRGGAPEEVPGVVGAGGAASTGAGAYTWPSPGSASKAIIAALVIKSEPEADLVARAHEMISLLRSVRTPAAR